MIGVSESKLAATRAALREALTEADDRGTRFYIREALQHLDTLERRRSRDDGERTDADRDDAGDGGVPVLSIGSRGDAAGDDIDGVETAEFPAHELDRN